MDPQQPEPESGGGMCAEIKGERDEDPSYPARLESSTPASLLVEQQQLQTNFHILSEHLSQTETQHRYYFFAGRHFVSAILFLT